MVEQMEQDISIELPTCGKIIAAKAPPAPPVVVNVRALPPLGRPVYSVGGETLSLLDLQQRLTWQRMQRKEQASVVVRGDKNVRWEHIAVVLAFCARAGITKVSATFEILEGA
jgi:biopolymer transport protein ExbD